MNTSPTQARQRAMLILQVQAGQITATAAAQQLGLSRKSYYQWEKRALAALLEAVEQQPPGRPSQATDREKEQLRQQVTQLQQQVAELEQVLKLRQLVQQFQTRDPKKNPARANLPPPRRRCPVRHRSERAAAVPVSWPGSSHLWPLATAAAGRSSLAQAAGTGQDRSLALDPGAEANSAIKPWPPAYPGHAGLISL